MFEKAGKYEQENKLNVLIYGLSGAGKTTMSSKLKGKVCYILSEAHHKRTVAQSNPDALIFVPKSWEELGKAFTYIRNLKGEDACDAVVLDSVGDMQEMLKQKICAESGTTAPTMQGWQIILDQSFQMLRKFRDLPCSVVFVCTAKEIEEDAGDDRAKTLLRPNLVGRQSDKRLMAMVHAAGYAFISKSGDGLSHHCVWRSSNDKVLTKGAGALPKVTGQDINEIFSLAVQVADVNKV